MRQLEFNYARDKTQYIIQGIDEGIEVLHTLYDCK